MGIPGFNSTLVRLKVLCAILKHKTRERFNSTLVRLKVQNISGEELRHLSFNSTLVRLKKLTSGGGSAMVLSFNSTLVRLKATVSSDIRHYNTNWRLCAVEPQHDTPIYAGLGSKRSSYYRLV